MALLNDCGNIYYQYLPACADGFTVAFGLDANTDYWWTLTDKFDRVYSEVVTTDTDGAFIISASDFPEGFFNEYAGPMVFQIRSNPYNCDYASMNVCGIGYSKAVLEFRNGGNLPAKIPCECS